MVFSAFGDDSVIILYGLLMFSFPKYLKAVTEIARNSWTYGIVM